MNLNDHLSKIVEGLVNDITANVVVKIDSIISNSINSRLENYDYATHVKEAATAAFEKRVSDYAIDPKKLENKIVEKINQTIENVKSITEDKVQSAVATQVAAIDFHKAMADAVSTIVNDKIAEYNFPDNSIPIQSLKFGNTKLSGDQIQGGIIQNFGSSGIDDKATQVALTILDSATVIENNLITKDLTVEGAVTINGSFDLVGSVKKESVFYQTLVSDAKQSTMSSLNQTLFDSYSNLVWDKIKNEGVDLSKISINGKEILNEKSLSSSVTESNLQKVGQLKELQVQGESFFAETLYVTAKRVGVNTIEPSAALSIWDEEIEITAGKKQKDVASISTPRSQKLLLSANNKENLILDTDGSTRINDLRIGTMRFTTASSPPNYVSDRGHVVWNNNPNPGGPLGWICLGAANWANFGIID